MKKYLLGLAAGAVLVLGSAANADCDGCGGYDVKLNVNGNPFMGRWAMVDDRPYVGIEAFSTAVGVPSTHYYKGWSLSKTPSENISPLDLGVKSGDTELETIRFGGVTMVDLYKAAAALDVPVHHNFRNKTIEVGKNYHGEYMKGETYRHMSRTRGWVDADYVERYRHGMDYNHENNNVLVPMEKSDD